MNIYARSELNTMLRTSKELRDFNVDTSDLIGAIQQCIHTTEQHVTPLDKTHSTTTLSENQQTATLSENQDTATLTGNQDN